MKYLPLSLWVKLLTGLVFTSLVLKQQPAPKDLYHSLKQLKPRLYQIMVPHRYKNIPYSSYVFPGFYSKKPTGGLLRVICFPKDTALWNKTWHKLLSDKNGKLMGGHNELTFPYVNRILADNTTQNLFDIYALFVEEKNTIWESDLQSKVKMPHFPCPVLIYKRTNEDWVLDKKQTFKNWDEYVKFIPEQRKDLLQ